LFWWQSYSWFFLLLVLGQAVKRLGNSCEFYFEGVHVEMIYCYLLFYLYIYLFSYLFLCLFVDLFIYLFLLLLLLLLAIIIIIFMFICLL